MLPVATTTANHQHRKKDQEGETQEECGRGQRANEAARAAKRNGAPRAWFPVVPMHVGEDKDSNHIDRQRKPNSVLRQTHSASSLLQASTAAKELWHTTMLRAAPAQHSLPGRCSTPRVKHSTNLAMPRAVTSESPSFVTAALPAGLRLHRTPLISGHRRVVLTRFQPDASSPPETRRGVMAPGTVVPVMFEMVKSCAFGQGFAVAGSAPELGAWEPQRAVPLQWSPGDRWYAVVPMAAGQAVEFKFLQVNAQANNAFTRWVNEVCGDHNLQLSIQEGGDLVMGNVAVHVLETGEAVPGVGPTPPGVAATSPGEPAGPAIPTPEWEPGTVTPGDAEERELTAPEKIGDTMRPLVSGVSAKVSGIAASVTQPVKEAAVGLGRRAEEACAGGVEVGGAAPIKAAAVDAAEPGTQGVMTDEQAAQPHVARHIISDTLTTDTYLGGAPPGTIVEPASLAHVDQSSLHYRPEHPEIREQIAAVGGGAAGAAPAVPPPPAPKAPVPPPAAPTPPPTVTRESLVEERVEQRPSVDSPSGVADVSVLPTTGEDLTGGSLYSAWLRKHTPPITGEAARTTLAEDAGLTLPISSSLATASSILSNMAGGDEEMPEAPMHSGLTPTTGSSMVGGGSMLNPKANPVAMAVRAFVALFGADDATAQYAQVSICEGANDGLSRLGMTNPDLGDAWVPPSVTAPAAGEETASQLPSRPAPPPPPPLPVFEPDDPAYAPESGCLRGSPPPPAPASGPGKDAGVGGGRGAVLQREAAGVVQPGQQEPE